MKSAFFAALALSGAACGLAACGDGAPAVTRAPATLTAANAKLALPAVKGNPGAVYVDLTNPGSEDAMIRSVSVEGTQSAAMHSMIDQAGTMVMAEVIQQPVKPGETLKFAPGGMHLMVFGIPDTMKPGGTAQVTLTLLRGEKVSFPAEIHKAGDLR